jgi:hypothetical protein
VEGGANNGRIHVESLRALRAVGGACFSFRAPRSIQRKTFLTRRTLTHVEALFFNGT